MNIQDIDLFERAWVAMEENGDGVVSVVGAFLSADQARKFLKEPSASIRHLFLFAEKRGANEGSN